MYVAQEGGDWSFKWDLGNKLTLAALQKEYLEVQYWKGMKKGQQWRTPKEKSAQKKRYCRRKYLWLWVEQ